MLLRKLNKCVCTISVSGICFYLEFEKYCLIVYFSCRWAGCLWKIALATESIFICYRLITIFICVKHSYIWMEAKESLTRVMVLLPCSKDSWKSILNARCLLETASAQVSCLLILFSVLFIFFFFCLLVCSFVCGFWVWRLVRRINYFKRNHRYNWCITE